MLGFYETLITESDDSRTDKRDYYYFMELFLDSDFIPLNCFRNLSKVSSR